MNRSHAETRRHQEGKEMENPLRLCVFPLRRSFGGQVSAAGERKKKLESRPAKVSLFCQSAGIRTSRRRQRDQSPRSALEIPSNLNLAGPVAWP